MGDFGILHLIGLAALWYFIGRPIYQGYKEGRHGDEESRAGRPLANSAYQWPSLGDFAFEVVGESHYQRALAKLAGSHGDADTRIQIVVQLVPDDANRYDPKAVEVQCNGQTLGHLSREDARSFRRRLGQKGLTGAVTTCDAVILGGGIGADGGRRYYGVWLDIKPFE